MLHQHAVLKSEWWFIKIEYVYTVINKIIVLIYNITNIYKLLFFMKNWKERISKNIMLLILMCLEPTSWIGIRES